MQYGIMKEGAVLLGTGLRLNKGQRVLLEPANNIPNAENKWFASPADGKWPSGIENNDWSILIDQDEVALA